MSETNPIAVASHVRWDGQMVLFDLLAAGEEIPCAISRAALEQLGTRRCFKKDEALACFERKRDFITACANGKFNARSSDLCGRLTLWADDLEFGEAEVPA